MKKKVLSLLMGLLLSSQLALAQDDFEFASNDGGLSYGIKIGGNFNTFSQPGVTFGGNGGLFLRYPFGDVIALQGELLYDFQGGGRHDYTVTTETGVDERSLQTVSFLNRNLQLHTVSLPISAKITPFDKGTVTPYFLAGGSLEYVFSAYEVRDVLFNQNGATNVILTNQGESLTDDIESLQYGFHVGTGLDFYQDSGSVFSIEFRYRQSLTDLNSGIDDFSNSLRPQLSALYSSTFSISFYSTLNLF